MTGAVTLTQRVVGDVRCDLRRGTFRWVWFVFVSASPISIVLVTAGEAARVSGTVVLTGKRKAQTQKERVTEKEN